MKDEWILFGIKYLALPIIALVFGIVIGFGLVDSPKKPLKQYPIEVQCHWETNGYQGNPTMEVDSVKGDTIYKDGLKIVNKNIVNIQFK
jgi:hypothetical protein